MLRTGPIGPGTEVTPGEFVDRARPAKQGPWVEICMITTPDGATSKEGKSSPLGGPADQAMLKAWRSVCGVIMVGAGTVRAEGYGVPSRADLRVAVVTKSCNVDAGLPIFTSGRGFLLTTTDAPQTSVETLRCGTGEVDLHGAVTELGQTYPGGPIHVEGGPALNAALLRDDLVDAINLTFSHRLAGPHSGDPIATSFVPSRRFEIADAATQDGFVFVRYERVR